MGSVMSKTPIRRQQGATRARTAHDTEFPTTRGVTIVSGANVPQIDLEALFSRRPAAESATHPPLNGAVLAGGGANVPSRDSATPMPKSQTVALADGTRITFASADLVNLLESA